MTIQFSEKSMQRTVPYFTMVTVLAVLSLCMTSAAYSAAPTALKTYSVTVTASPKSQSAAPGGTANVVFAQKNTGSSSFTVTGCVIEVATSSAGPYSDVSCTVSHSYSIPAHKTVGTTYTLTLSTTITAGKYYFRFYATGKVGSSSDKTKTASFTITVT
jgi:hypothetical protein